MSSTLSTKLTVIYYVEAGCLGLKGEQLIHHFCDFMSKKLDQVSNELCTWSVQPLININKPHIEYFIQKQLTGDQAQQFLQKHNKDIKQFEDNLDDLAIHFIEDYLGRC